MDFETFIETAIIYYLDFTESMFDFSCDLC